MPRPLYDRSSIKLPKLGKPMEGVAPIAASNPPTMSPSHPSHPANFDIGGKAAKSLGTVLGGIPAPNGSAQKPITKAGANAKGMKMPAPKPMKPGK